MLTVLCLPARSDCFNAKWPVSKIVIHSYALTNVQNLVCGMDSIVYPVCPEENISFEGDGERVVKGREEEESSRSIRVGVLEVVQEGVNPVDPLSRIVNGQTVGPY